MDGISFKLVNTASYNFDRRSSPIHPQLIIMYKSFSTYLTNMHTDGAAWFDPLTIRIMSDFRHNTMQHLL